MSDLGECAIQTYNGGIMFVSYLISVVGAQTTLELLSRRTHINGAYNWFLLTSAAFVMGAVSIWSMHFIGNNSMTLYIYENHYQLSYSAGYTFASLVVAIAIMFLAFVFVGITEDAQLIRIVPSGIFAGLGIVCMHYMGQFAITYFKLVYRPAYLGGAIVIACVAVTAALYIFFKLREKWMNQWYKRLGCALLMALAVCGMHYTGLVGTDFYLPNYDGNPIPLPKLKTAALIGIIAAIIVIACIVLLYISIKAGMKNLPRYVKNTNKRLILDAVMFDPIGRVLVKIDGTLPMTEIVHNLELNESKQEFNAHHPLFHRLYETAIQKASARLGFEKRPSGLSATSTLEAYDMIENQFLEGCRELKEELRLSHFSDLGILSDIVVTTDTIAKSSSVFTSKKKNGRFKKSSAKDRPLTEIELTFQRVNQNHMTDEDEEPSRKKKFSSKNWRHKKSEDEETAIESFSTNGKRSSGGTTVVNRDHRSSSEDTNDGKSVNDRLSVEDSDGEDKHIFMVRKLDSERQVDRLLSQGYRFAETVFISKTMATKLKIPTDHMRNHFNDMQQLADSLCALTQHDWIPSTVEPAPNPTVFTASPKQTVVMGAFVLIDETKDMTNTQILVEKSKRFSFPSVQVKSELEALPVLERNQAEFLFLLQGRSLYDFAQLKQTLVQLQMETEEKGLFEKLPDESFLSGIEQAAQQLIDMTSYSKALYQSSKLHATILDLPPFALTTGPCQLILFKSFVTTQGAITAINHTFSEPMKCIPLQLYRPLCGFITDQAASIYQSSTQARTLPTYLLQQQMYRQQTHYPAEESKSSIPMETFKERVVVEEDQQVSDSFSLPPPPRAKRNRFKLTNAILNNSPFDLVKTMANPPKALQAAPLTVLATQDRFWWVNPIVEETIHSSM